MFWHWEVPIGGNVGGVIGWIEGGTNWQIVGGHIGGISIEFEQIGVICPLTHLHTQLPKELDVSRNVNMNIKIFIILTISTSMIVW